MDVFLINLTHKSFIRYTSKQRNYQNTLKDSLEQFFFFFADIVTKLYVCQLKTDEKWQRAFWIESQEDKNSSLVSIADLFNDCSVFITYS